ncbi:MAG TPA: hypothetical protein VHX38_02680 [Pseudonocardiaceae bacterium]|nr:hypothetical protein [Pseudonocardiaceae bacterium]
MNAVLLIGLIGAAAWIPGLWGIVDGWRKRRAERDQQADEGDRLVVKSAVELLKPYRERVEELESKLSGAERTIRDMTGQLRSANARAEDLNSKLADAQTELNFLRLQVKTMSQQLPPSP